MQKALILMMNVNFQIKKWQIKKFLKQILIWKSLN